MRFAKPNAGCELLDAGREAGGRLTHWGDMNKEYCGDGVYVELEDGMIKLTTSNGLEDTNTVYLEPEVWTCLMRWATANRPFDASHRKPLTPEHVCGLSGYNGMIDPPCPGCEYRMNR